MNRTWVSTFCYAFAHFAVDLGCAFAMFSACRGSPVAFLCYNFCAFAMQMPLGLLADVVGHGRRFALAGAAAVAGLCLLPSFGLAGAAVLGLGNGAFHVGGGVDVMHRSGERAAPLGVFVSPGAFGVYLGTLWGKGGLSPLPVLGALLLAGGVMLLFCPSGDAAPPSPALPERSVVLPAALLFLVVVLRSYGGMAAGFSWKSGVWVTASVSAVVLGKTLGGFLSDRVGLLRAAGWSLGLCALLFLAEGSAPCGVAALLLFNMTMPMTLFALSRRMPGCRGFSFGLLTFALFLGYLPSYLGAEGIGSLGMAVVAALSAALLLPVVRREPG